MLVCFIFLDAFQDLFLYLFLGLYSLYFFLFFFLTGLQTKKFMSCQTALKGGQGWAAEQAAPSLGGRKMCPCLYSANEEQDVHGVEQMLPGSVLGHVCGR